MSDYNSLTDDELYDIGMTRCPCGEAIYSDGLVPPHCAEEALGRWSKTFTDY